MDRNREYDIELKDKIAHMADSMEPDDVIKEQIWEDIKIGRRRRSVSFGRIASIAAGLLLFLTCGALTVNATTDGALFASIRLFYGRQEQQTVKVQTIQLPIEVYAPQLVACSDEYVIFANERGLVVYDTVLDKVAESLDLQALDMNYLNADSIETCIFMKDDVLYLFNQRKKSKQGETLDAEKQIEVRQEAYIYYPDRAGQEDALFVSRDAGTLKAIRKDWEAYRKNAVRDTFDEMQEKVIDLNELAGHGEASYSESCIAWQSADGDRRESFLVVTDDHRFWLYTRQMTDDSLSKRELTVWAQDVAAGETESAEGDPDGGNAQVGPEADSLPAFEYTGDDEIIRALCAESMKQADSYYRSEGSVFIPTPYVYETVTDGEDVIVFCSLSEASYYRNGNTLNSESGGSDASRVRLTPDGNGGYSVAEALTAGDGSGYMEDIRSFCEGYAVSPDIYLSSEQNDEGVRKEMIKMYVTDNNLDIRYYKDYGWDPIEIE